MKRTEAVGMIAGCEQRLFQVEEFVRLKVISNQDFQRMINQLEDARNKLALVRLDLDKLEMRGEQ